MPPAFRGQECPRHTFKTSRPSPPYPCGGIRLWLAQLETSRCRCSRRARESLRPLTLSRLARSSRLRLPGTLSARLTTHFHTGLSESGQKESPLKPLPKLRPASSRSLGREIHERKVLPSMDPA